MEALKTLNGAILFFNSALLLFDFFMNSASDVDPFFIFSLIFIIIIHIISLKQTRWFFAHSLEHLILVLDDNMDEERE